MPEKIAGDSGPTAAHAERDRDRTLGLPTKPPASLPDERPDPTRRATGEQDDTVPRASQPATTAATTPPTPAAAPPLLHIDQIDIVIEAPPTPGPTEAGPPTSASDLTSRFYLRRL